MMDLLKEIPADEKIKDLGDFVLDQDHEIFGFTLTMENGEIMNFFIRGNFWESEDDIQVLYERYKKLRIKNKRKANSS